MPNVIKQKSYKNAKAFLKKLHTFSINKYISICIFYINIKLNVFSKISLNFMINLIVTLCLAGNYLHVIIK